MADIFVSVAAYRDPELAKTVADCVAKAAQPSRLRFGIAWQRGEGDVAVPESLSNQCKILDIPFSESQGACWARSRIQEECYDGERYYFQLDSHHRFAPRWDEQMIRQLEQCESALPILTAYVHSYDIHNDSSLDETVWRMNADYFDRFSVLYFRPAPVHRWRDVNSPIPARYFSAHCTFTTREFVEKVPYDPLLYFSGEEITLAMRAFTHGFDLFHPYRNLVWHEYKREKRVKHWDDHSRKTASIKTTWAERDAVSKARCQRLLVGDASDMGKYGLGDVRSRDQYARHAGVCFKSQRIHPSAKSGSAITDEQYEQWLIQPMIRRTYRLTLSDEELRIPDDCDFCFVGFEDKNGVLLYRSDLMSADAAKIKRLGKVETTYEFESYASPDHAVVWPHSVSNGWLGKRVYNL